MNKKILLLFVGIVITFLVSIVWLLLIEKHQPKQPPKDFTINTNTEFISASNLLKEKKYMEAEKIFSTLENLKTNTVQDLAFLRLKKLQILLAENKYVEAVEILEEIITNPQFPQKTKGRAVENVFTIYIKNNKDPLLYEAIFSRETFKSLKSDTPLESIYNFVEYGYNLQATTVLGANVLYSKIDKVQRLKIENPKEYEESLNTISEFSKIFFAESDKEIELLSKQKFQEVALINIYTERSRVIKRLSRLNLTIPNNPSTEGELVAAFNQAVLLDDPFYLFYTGFNYLDFISANKKEIAQDIKKVIENKKIFSKDNVQKQWLILVMSPSLSKSKEVQFAPYNTELVEVIKNEL